jgi:ribulose 1,5-bisphosphate carboxylase large subunit-like protein
VIASEEEEVRMIVQKEGKLFDVNYPTSFANLLGPYNGLNIVGHMLKRMRRFIVANLLKPELLLSSAQILCVCDGCLCS